MAYASPVSMVTGFAINGGVAAVSDVVKAQPEKLNTLVVVADT